MAATIHLENKHTSPESLWFDLPENVSPAVNGDVWLLSILPLAFSRGEKLRISAPVDSQLEANARQLMTVWSRWFPKVQPITIECEHAPEVPMPERPRGAFFTGGIDSFYSVLQSDDSTSDGQDSLSRVQCLIYVWGFDIPLRNRAAFERKRMALERIADQLGKELVIVVTNLRDTALGRLEWGQLAHGPALGAVASLLGNHLSSVLLSASSNAIDDDTPWGSHALTDALLSSGRVRMIRFGERESRFEKSARVVQSEVALRHLHVCWKDASDRNCGKCEKCLRTMTALDVLEALEKTRCFPRSTSLSELLESVRVREPLAVPLWEEMRDPALAAGRHDLVAAIDRVLERSRAPAPLEFLKRMERRFRVMRKTVLRHE